MKFKICCIKSLEEANIAIEAGAKIIGLVGPMPSGPGPITPQEAGVISANIPSDIASFYLTSKTELESISNEYNQVMSTHIQLTDHVSHEVRNKLKSRYPDLQLVQVVHVISESSIEEAMDYASSADLLLLDSGSPHKAVKELGGTGRIHNWNISRRIIESVQIPVFLAGGINANNVKEAINKVKPYGIDLCSGVRTDDALDIAKLEQFIKAIK